MTRIIFSSLAYSTFITVASIAIGSALVAFGFALGNLWGVA